MGLVVIHLFCNPYLNPSPTSRLNPNPNNNAYIASKCPEMTEKFTCASQSMLNCGSILRLVISFLTQMCTKSLVKMCTKF